MTPEENNTLYISISNLMTQYGVVDFYYGGVELNGSDIQTAIVGHGELSQGNRARKLHMIGVMSDHIYALQSTRKLDEEVE